MREESLESIYHLAKANEKIVFIGSDLGPATLEHFRQEMPDRFFMEGISEQHAIGMAAGLAMEGFIPFVNTIGTFLTRRCFDQIVVDLGLHHLPVRLLGYGGGVVYAPLGPTHLATEDIAILRTIPGFAIVAPSDAEEMKSLMPLIAEYPSPMYIRLARGDDDVIFNKQADEIKIGKALLYAEPGDLLFISTGVMTQRALKARECLMSQGISAGVLHTHTIKPLDEDEILRCAEQVPLVIIIEEHIRNGGLGSAVLELLMDKLQHCPRVVRLGLPDQFVDQYGTQETLLERYELTSDALSRTATQYLNEIVSVKV